MGSGGLLRCSRSWHMWVYISTAWISGTLVRFPIGSMVIRASVMSVGISCRVAPLNRRSSVIFSGFTGGAWTLGSLIGWTSPVTISTGATRIFVTPTRSRASRMWELSCSRFDLMYILFESVRYLSWMLFALTIWANILTAISSVADLVGWLMGWCLIGQTLFGRSFWRSTMHLGILSRITPMMATTLIIFTASRITYLARSCSIEILLISWGIASCTASAILIAERAIIRGSALVTSRIISLTISKLRRSSSHIGCLRRASFNLVSCKFL